MRLLKRSNFLISALCLSIAAIATGAQLGKVGTARQEQVGDRASAEAENWLFTLSEDLDATARDHARSRFKDWQDTIGSVVVLRELAPWLTDARAADARRLTTNALTLFYWVEATLLERVGVFEEQLRIPGHVYPKAEVDLFDYLVVPGLHPEWHEQSGAVRSRDLHPELRAFTVTPEGEHDKFRYYLHWTRPCQSARAAQEKAPGTPNAEAAALVEEACQAASTRSNLRRERTYEERVAAVEEELGLLDQARVSGSSDTAFAITGLVSRDKYLLRNGRSLLQAIVDSTVASEAADLASRVLAKSIERFGRDLESESR